MSFFSLNQKELSKVLSTCNLISQKKSEIEIFTYLRLTITPQKVDFAAISQVAFYEKSLKVVSTDITEELVFLVKTDVIANTVSLFSDDVLSLECNLEKSTLTIQGTKSKHVLRIDTSMTKDFVIPTEKPENLEVSVEVLPSDLITANKAVMISVGNPRTVYQPEFLNVCYTIKPEEKLMNIVSTDRYRITKNIVVANFSNISEEITAAGIQDYLINPRGLSILSMCIDSETSITLKFEKDYMWVLLEGGKLVLRYGEGKFPEYDRIIPQSFSCSFLVSSKEVLTALKQVYISARSNVNNKSITISVSPSNQKITFSAQTQDGYSSESVVDIANYEGVEDDWNQAFNADYLIDYISSVSTENLLWEANPGKPSVLSPEGQKSKQFYLVSGLK